MKSKNTEYKNSMQIKFKYILTKKHESECELQ